MERIAAERRLGWTMQAIADGLNRDQVANVNPGAQWWPSTVAWVLSRVETGA
ncbi:MAG: hypothetical protein ACYDC5_05360 [Candidatus Dormibacteria bacterium]